MGRAQCRLADQVQLHAPGVGLVQDVLRHHLHRQRLVAEPLDRRAELVRGVGDELVRDRHAVRAQQRPRLVLVEVAALVLGAREHRLHRLVGRHAGLKRLAVAVLQVEAALGERLQHLHRLLDRRIHRQPGLVQAAQRGRLDRGVEAIDHQRFGAGARELDHRLGRAHLAAEQGLGEAGVVAAEHADEEDRIDVVVVGDDLDAARQHLGVGVRAAGHVHRIRQRRLREQDRRQALARGLRQLGEFQAGLRQAVGGDRGLAAAVGDHRHAPAARLLHQRQALGHRQDLVGVMHHAHADLAQQVHRHRVAAGERAGVGAGGLLAELGGARLVHHHRLHRGDLARRLEEALAVAEALHVQRGHAGVLVLAEVAQVVVEADVGLVARTDVGREAHVAVVLGLQHQRQQHVARLRDEADVARPGVAQVEQVDLVVQVEHARGVGADDAHAARTRRVQHLLLEPGALRPGLAEAAGEDHRALDALAPALLEQPGQGLRRGADQRQVDRPGNVVERGAGRHAEDLGHLGVDRVDAPAVVALDEADHGLVAALGGIGRGAHDRDRGGGEEVVQRAAARRAAGHGARVLAHVIPP